MQEAKYVSEHDVLVVIDKTGVHMGLPEDELPMGRKLRQWCAPPLASQCVLCAVKGCSASYDSIALCCILHWKLTSAGTCRPIHTSSGEASPGCARPTSQLDNAIPVSYTHLTLPTKA